MCIVATSKWMTENAKKSALFSDFRVETIPFGLPSDIFQMHNKIKIRKKLGFPVNKFLILFGADYNTKRKGVNYLLKALELLAKDVNDIELVVFGDCQLKNPNFKQHDVGKINDEARLAEYYSASDIFIMPSIEEAFGQTAIEAMACGTPVIGFGTGGIKDIILDNKTGLLAKLKDSKDLANKIRWMFEHKKKSDQMGINARDIIEKKYTLNIQAQRYIKLYKDLLNN
jgi:glycosyltransferase involved in cell wall biosynthesis